MKPPAKALLNQMLRVHTTILWTFQVFCPQTTLASAKSPDSSILYGAGSVWPHTPHQHFIRNAKLT